MENNILLESALWYASKDWKITPCHGIGSDLRCTCREGHADPKDVGKHPFGPWNTQNTSDPETIRRWWTSEPMYNIGVVCRASGFVVLDIDPRNGGFESWDKFQEMLGEPLPKTIESLTGNYSLGGKIVRGRHIFFKCDSSEELIGNLDNAGLKGIDVKHNGYVLLTPSNHYSGVKYEWAAGHRPDDLPIADAPEFLLEALRKGRSRTKGTALGSTDWDAVFSKVKGAEKADITKLLTDGLKEGGRAVGVYKIACVLANLYPVHEMHGELAVETLMIRFNHEKVVPPLELEGPNGLLMHTRRAIEFVKKHPKIDMITGGQPLSFEAVEWATKLNEEQVSKSVDGDNSYKLVDKDSLILDALASGKTIEQATSNRSIGIAPDQDSIYVEDGGKPGQRSLTDIGNGRRLIDKFGDVIRYTDGFDWFAWRGERWVADKGNLHLREYAKKIGSIVKSEVDSYGEDTNKKLKVVQWGESSKSMARVKSAIEAAVSDNRVVVDADTWDSFPELLGVTNGVVNLRTGELLKNKPNLFITHSCAVGYIPGQFNERWDNFLEFVTGGDREYRDWLQKAAGYTLTGHRNHDVLFLVYGPANTGKNTFVEALFKCLGGKQYAMVLDASLITQNDGKPNNSDQYSWAEFRGRRMIWSDELADRERIKENSIKRLTGSSEISGRFPGGRPFTFTSQTKLWITTNNKPIITDEAMWRRIRAIPFTKLSTEIDKTLREYMFDPDGGLPAVLSWAVEGAMKLLSSTDNDQLGTCKVVWDASELYRATEDRLGMFLNEETVEAEGGSIPMKDLFVLYQIWSEGRGERPLMQLTFDRKMRERSGLKVDGTGNRAVVYGRIMPTRNVGSEPIPILGFFAANHLDNWERGSV